MILLYEPFYLNHINELKVYVEGFAKSSFTLVGIILLFKIGYGVMNLFWFNDTGQNSTTKNALLGGVLLLMLHIYPSVGTGVINLLDALPNYYIATSERKAVEREHALEEIKKSQTQAEKLQAGVQSAVTVYLKALTFSSTLASWATWSVTRLLSWIAKNTIKVFIKFMNLLMFLFAPLCLCFSFFPSFSNKIPNFFGTWLAIHFWAVTLFGIDMVNNVFVQNGMIESVSAGGSFNLSDSVYSLIGQFLVVGAYISTPFLTSLYMPSSGGEMFTAVTAATTMAVKAGLAYASGGASLLK